MKKLLISLLVGAMLGAPALARPRTETSPGLNARTPAVKYLKWEALTSLQQERLCEVWNISPAEAAVKWNALQAIDQRNLLLKYGLIQAL